MVKKHVKSKPGLFGMMYHYDENGKYVGRSRPGLIDDTLVHFDKNDKRIAGSRPGILWDKVTTDQRNKRKIISFESFFYTLHKSEGKVIGKSRPHIMDRVYTETADEDECSGRQAAFTMESLNNKEKGTKIGERKDAPSNSKLLKKVLKTLIGVISLVGALFFCLAVIALLYSRNFSISTLLICICLSLLMCKAAQWGLNPTGKRIN